MTRERKSKRVYWEIMIRLEEAGEEDVCALLNDVMGEQPYFGSGRDLSEYLDAIVALERQGELCLREYLVEGGLTTYPDAIPEHQAELQAAFAFDSARRRWKWIGTPRQMVEVPPCQPIQSWKSS